MGETLPCRDIQRYPEEWETPHSSSVSTLVAVSAAISYSICANPTASITCQLHLGHYLSPPPNTPNSVLLEGKAVGQ